MIKAVGGVGQWGYSADSLLPASLYREPPLFAMPPCPPRSISLWGFTTRSADARAAPPSVSQSGCIAGQDPSFQALNLIKTIAVLRRTAVIIDDRAK